MAELRCSDGTVIQISKETEQELRKAFGPQPTYSVGNVVYREYSGTPGCNYFRIVASENGKVGLRSLLDFSTVSACNGWRSVQNKRKITQKELESLTAYPEGLRKARKLVISEVDVK